MTHRERWTVYPLLFLSLGVALRDKFVPTFEADLIRCRGVVVTGADGADVVRLGSGQQGGRLELNDDEGRPLVILERGAKGGTVITYDSNRVPRNLGPTYVYESRFLEGPRLLGTPPPQDP